MEDIDESSSEQNITVNSIADYSESVYTVNTKEYNLTLPKDPGDHTYRQIIGFNMFKLPRKGKYTLCAEFFFPRSATNISVYRGG